MAGNTLILRFNILKFDEDAEIIFTLPTWPVLGMASGTTNEGKGYVLYNCSLFFILKLDKNSFNLLTTGALAVT